MAFALFGCIGVGALWAKDRSLHADARLAVTEILATAQSRAKDPDGKVGPTPASSQAQGDFGVVSEFSSAVIAEQQQLSAGYLAELRAIGWSTLMNADQYANDHSMRKAKETIQAARLIVKKYKDLSETTARLAVERANALPLSDYFKKAFLKGFTRSAQESVVVREARWDNQSDIVDAYAGIVDFLSSAPGVWTVKDGKYLFRSNDDLARFRSLDKKIGEAIHREKELSAARKSRIQGPLESLKGELETR